MRIFLGSFILPSFLLLQYVVPLNRVLNLSLPHSHTLLFRAPLRTSAQQVMVWVGLLPHGAERTPSSVHRPRRRCRCESGYFFPVDFVSQEERPGGPSCGFGVTAATPARGGACVD